MFDLENEEDDLFLSDIGSLSQIYDKKQLYGNDRYKKRPLKNVNSYRDIRKDDIDKKLRSSNVVAKKTLDKLTKSFSERDEKLYSRYSSQDNIFPEKSSGTDLYDDDVQIIRNTDKEKLSPKFKTDIFQDDPVFDEFELSNIKSNVKHMDSSPKNSLSTSRTSSLSDSLSTFMQLKNNAKREFNNRHEDNSSTSSHFQMKDHLNIDIESQIRDKLNDESYSKWSKFVEVENIYNKKSSNEYNRRHFSTERYSTYDVKNLKQVSQELLDENYPNPNLNCANVAQPSYEFKVSSPEKIKDNSNSGFVFKNKTFRTISYDNGNQKSSNFDDDVIVLEENNTSNCGMDNSITKSAFSFTKDKSISSQLKFDDDLSQSSLSVNRNNTANMGCQIPVLSPVKARDTVINNTLSKSVPQYNMPSVMQQNFLIANSPGLKQAPMIGNQTVPIQNFSNPSYDTSNFVNSFRQPENIAMFQQYSGPPLQMMNMLPTNDNNTYSAFPNQHQSVQYIPNFQEPPVGWIPPVPSVTTSVSVVPFQPQLSSNNVPNVTQIPEAQTDKAKEEAVKDEWRQQNKNFMAQRDEYSQKYVALNEELNKLKKQKKFIQAESLLKENSRLQNEISNKMKAVKNIIDMFTKIIKDVPAPKNSPEKESVEDNKRQNFDQENKDVSKKRKYSRSRSRSRHRERSRSLSRSRHSRFTSRSRSRHRRRSHSRDKYRRHRSSNRSKSSVRKKDSEKEQDPVLESKNSDGSKLNSEMKDKQDSNSDSFKQQHSDKFKSTFQEVTANSINNNSNEILNKSQKNVTVSKEKTPEPELKIPVDNNQTFERDHCVNYVYYDPEVHWCRVCNVFPRTAKEYLLHLHDAEHKNLLTKHNLIDYPWHNTQVTNKKPVNPDAPTERIPIRGLPFFQSVAAWYCKLCNEWMGDLHCASAHLKSDLHEIKYAMFLESNPEWENEWLENRSNVLAESKDVNIDACRNPEPPTAVPLCSVPIETVDITKQKIESSSVKLKEKKKSRTSSISSVSSNSSSSSSSDSPSSTSSESSNSVNIKKKKRKKRKKSSSSKRKQIRKLSNKPNKHKSRTPECSLTPVKEKEKPNRLSSPEDLYGPQLPPPPPSLPPRIIRTRRESPKPTKNISKMSPNNTFIPSLKDDDDKFMEEWMNPVVNKSKEKEFLELKSKLKKKEVVEKGKNTALELKRRNDARQILENEGGINESKKNEDDVKLKSKSMEATSKSKKAGEDVKKVSIPLKGKFPFIGKMPSLKKNDDDKKSKIVIKGLASNVTEQNTKSISSTLSAAMQKQLEEYDGKEPDKCNLVVDMDINDDDDDEPFSIIVDENASRKKDFDETLKLLYPEEQKVETLTNSTILPPNSTALQTNSSIIPANQPNTTFVNTNVGIPANITQDYLVSLIESTLIEKLNLKIPGYENNSFKIAELASNMKQTLFANTAVPPPINTKLSEIVVADGMPSMQLSCDSKQAVPASGFPQSTVSAHIPSSVTSSNSHQMLAMLEQQQDSNLETAVGHIPIPSDQPPPLVKKKKNPISQKKRRHLRKLRERLEEQEKKLQEKIEEKAKNLTTDTNSINGSVSILTAEPNPEPATKVFEVSEDSDLALLGIDEADSAALQF